MFGGLSGLIFLMLLVGSIGVLGLILVIMGLLRDASGTKDPLVVLKLRYARGEITKEEYERMKKELRSE